MHALKVLGKLTPANLHEFLHLCEIIKLLKYDVEYFTYIRSYILLSSSHTNELYSEVPPM